AGLAAGVTLADEGYDVELFERSRLLGGRATSFEIGGVEVDNGQHVFLGCCTEFIDFVKSVGMGDKLFLQDRFEALVIAGNGKASRLRAARLPAPFHLVASFLGFSLLSMRAKLDIARALASARRAGEIPDRTFAQWLARQRQGEEAIRVFWRPFFVPALNEPLEEMDAREALFTLRTAFLSDAGAARFGYSTVPLAHIAEAAAKRFAQVHRSTSVASLELENNRVCALVATSGERREFDAFILALTPPQLSRLLGELARFGIPPLDAYTPHSILDVHLRISNRHGERSRTTDFSFAALIDSPLQWIFRKGEGYYACSMSAADEYLRKSTDDLIQLAWRELQAALPSLKGATLEHGAVTRNPEATFSAPRETVRSGPGTALSNLAIAGAWTATGWPDTMESAVRSGIAAARQIVRPSRRRLS
ncbi:MAG TPA: hydroxysqualene dehydroxylase HpnE, partial [Candidatus Tyrphobacter sp.]